MHQRLTTMGTLGNRAAVAAVLVLGAFGLLLSCGKREDRAERDPQLVMVQLVKRAELQDTTARTVELDGRSLADVVPAKAFPDGRLPDLPKVPDGRTRVAALLPGCQEQLDPVLEEQRGRWVARFPEPEHPVNCVVADYYVAVWDVPA